MHAIMGRVSRRGVVKKWSKSYVYAKFGIEALVTLPKKIPHSLSSL
jgi:hypothetical protein